MQIHRMCGHHMENQNWLAAFQQAGVARPLSYLTLVKLLIKTMRLKTLSPSACIWSGTAGAQDSTTCMPMIIMSIIIKVQVPVSNLRKHTIHANIIRLLALKIMWSGYKLPCTRPSSGSCWRTADSASTVLTVVNLIKDTDKGQLQNQLQIQGVILKHAMSLPLRTNHVKSWVDAFPAATGLSIRLQQNAAKCYKNAMKHAKNKSRTTQTLQNATKTVFWHVTCSIT